MQEGQLACCTKDDWHVKCNRFSAHTGSARTGSIVVMAVCRCTT